MEEPIFSPIEIPAKYFTCIHLRCRSFHFHESWETSKHEPSWMVSLFIKTTASFYCCELGVSHRDFWLLEEESCDWMGPWKNSRKNNTPLITV